MMSNNPSQLSFPLNGHIVAQLLELNTKNNSKTLHPKYDNHLKLKYLLVFFTHFISWACLQLSEKENHQELNE